jgi:CheY-like chemotaxis protein
MLQSMSFEKQSWNNPEGPEGPRDKVNILLVDDRPENLAALEATLGDLDQNLFKAASGHEALKLLLDHEFALILLDVEMPHMDGFELARMIRGRNQSRQLPSSSSPRSARVNFTCFRDTPWAQSEEDGYSLIARLRARRPEQGGHLPAIALTAFNTPKDREQLLQAGFHMHVPKPVEPTDLVDSMARLTGHYSARAHRRQF